MLVTGNWERKKSISLSSHALLVWQDIRDCTTCLSILNVKCIFNTEAGNSVVVTGDAQVLKRVYTLNVSKEFCFSV